MTPALGLANEVVDDVEFFFKEQRDANSIWAGAGSFDTRIRRNIRLAEAPSHGESIFRYSSDSNGAQDYRSLAAEVMQQTLSLLGDDVEPAEHNGQVEDFLPPQPYQSRSVHEAFIENDFR